MLELDSLFAMLVPPSTSDESRFSAYPIPGYEQHRLAKNARGEPAILIALLNPVEANYQSSVALEHLVVQHNTVCQIVHPDGTSERGRFTALRCTKADAVLETYFLRVAGVLISSLGAAISQSEVARAIDSLVELFRAMSQPPRKSVQGLWAEMFLIAHSLDIQTMVRAWHINPEDRYDFAQGAQRLEVKSSSNRSRQHHFSLEQLSPPEGIDVLVASVFVEINGAGVSVRDLADSVQPCLKDNLELLFHLERTITLTLGEHWRYALEDRFDPKLADQSLGFFKTEVVPCIDRDLPIGVSDVHFKADLTGKPCLAPRELKDFGGLFRAASPKRNFSRSAA